MPQSALNTPLNCLVLLLSVLSCFSAVCGTYVGGWCPASANISTGLLGLTGAVLVGLIEQATPEEERSWTARVEQSQRVAVYVWQCVAWPCRLDNEIRLFRPREEQAEDILPRFQGDGVLLNDSCDTHFVAPIVPAATSFTDGSQAGITPTPLGLPPSLLHNGSLRRTISSASLEVWTGEKISDVEDSETDEPELSGPDSSTSSSDLPHSHAINHELIDLWRANDDSELRYRGKRSKPGVTFDFSNVDEWIPEDATTADDDGNERTGSPPRAVRPLPSHLFLSKGKKTFKSGGIPVSRGRLWVGPRKPLYKAQAALLDKAFVST